jgi:hypothetical protein
VKHGFSSLIDEDTSLQINDKHVHQVKIDSKVDELCNAENGRETIV